ncbi:MAG: ATP-binding cassette domain-containing protein [Pseudomonadota bacterium]
MAMTEPDARASDDEMSAPADGATALSLQSLRYVWPTGGDAAGFWIEVDALTIAKGERIFIEGPSGSGKSTLLSLICGVIAPQSGRIEVMGAPFSALPAADRDRIRAERFGVIFQMFNLLPYASPVQNVVLPLAFAPERAARVGRDRAGEARRLMAALGLPAAVIGARKASSLSVGQQQRVAVARALIGAPDIVVADEATSALGSGARDAFLEVMFDQAAVVGATLIMVSHDAALGDRFDRAVPLSSVARVGRTSAQERQR